MDTVVYPDSEVDDALSASWTGFKLNLLDKHPDFREASLGRAVPWAPTFLVTDAKGREVRRTVGWLGKPEFLAELELARAHFELTRWRFDEALAAFEGVPQDTRAAAEAAYYAGVAVFIRGKRDMQALADRWARLRADHPDSDWALKAAVIEDL